MIKSNIRWTSECTPRPGVVTTNAAGGTRHQGWPSDLGGTDVMYAPPPPPVYIGILAGVTRYQPPGQGPYFHSLCMTSCTTSMQSFSIPFGACISFSSCLISALFCLLNETARESSLCCFYSYLPAVGNEDGTRRPC